MTYTHLIDLAANYKAGIMTASTSVALSGAASMWTWIDVNLVKISAFAAFILTIVMIIAHICTTIRQNREHRINMRRQELEIEILKRKVNKNV